MNEIEVIIGGRADCIVGQIGDFRQFVAIGRDRISQTERKSRVVILVIIVTIAVIFAIFQTLNAPGQVLDGSVLFVPIGFGKLVN